MKDHTSLYLDVLRFSAAFLVFIFHAGHFSGAYIPVLGHLGSEAVIVFFVLSGLVVSFTSDQKHTDIVDYSLSRLARLWSVALPALAITLLADKIGQAINLSLYAPLQPLSAYKWLVLLPANAIFISQIWNFDLWPGSNGPFWSISYEFWYYCIFGFAFYFRGKARIVLVIGASVIAGPQILLAFPAWIFGSLVYFFIRRRGEIRHQRQYGYVLWIASIASLCAYTLCGATDFLQSVFAASAKIAKYEVDFWPKTYFIAFFIAVNIYGFDIAGGVAAGALMKYRRHIRLLADWSFGLYLFHYPLGYLCKVLASLFLEAGRAPSVLFIYGTSFAMSVGLACLCEAHKRDVNLIVRSAFHLAVPKRLVEIMCAAGRAPRTEPAAPVVVRTPNPSPLT